MYGTPCTTPPDLAQQKPLPRPGDLDGIGLVEAANQALDRVNATAADWLIVAEAYKHRPFWRWPRRIVTSRPAKPTTRRSRLGVSGRTSASDRIDKYERRDLARIMANRPAFDDWRATLTADQRRASESIRS